MEKHGHRTFNIYVHVMDDATPGSKAATGIPQLIPQPSISPIRVRQRVGKLRMKQPYKEIRSIFKHPQDLYLTEFEEDEIYESILLLIGPDTFT